MIEAEWWDYDDADELAEAVAGDIGFIADSAIDARDAALLALPGDAPAAILTKLNARTASAILSEMEAARAAQLARMMTDVGKKARESEKS